MCSHIRSPSWNMCALCARICALYMSLYTRVYANSNSYSQYVHSVPRMYTGWQRPLECLTLQVIFRKRATNYKALVRTMTYEDKPSYGSLPPCISHTWCLTYITWHLQILRLNTVFHMFCKTHMKWLDGLLKLLGIWHCITWLIAQITWYLPIDWRCFCYPIRNSPLALLC